MGAWGTALYSNDVACDIRGDYKDALRRGKSNEEITNRMIEQNKDYFGTEDEGLFWFALADTQWNYGRLMPEVKEKALFFIENDHDDRWETNKDRLAWSNTLAKLKDKLLSEQPPEKKVSKYRTYHCEWKLGDVYAYRFSSDYSKETGFYNKYVVFRKISECRAWPDHIIPIVQFYNRIWDNIPTLENITACELLITDYRQNEYLKTPRIGYNIKLLNTSKRIIPYDHLTYLGNIGGDDLIPYKGPEYYFSYYTVEWKTNNINRLFEHFVIEEYNKWYNHQSRNDQ